MAHIRQDHFKPAEDTKTDGDPDRHFGLIYGLDPHIPAHARIILDTPDKFSPVRRALAFATLKQARGETCDRSRMIRDALAMTRAQNFIHAVEVTA